MYCLLLRGAGLISPSMLRCSDSGNPLQSAYALLLSHCLVIVWTNYYLILFDLLIVVKHRIRQICPILPLPGRPPLVYMNPRLPSVQRDWVVIGGGKAPDGGLGWLGPIRNRLLCSGGRLHL